MANNLSSNTVEDLARIFLKHAESSRVVTKTVNTQLLNGRFTPRTGGQVSMKRPHMYNSIETSDGDISLSTKSDIISGKATATVQDYLTVAMEWDNIEEALELDQLDAILKPAARRLVTDLEVNLGGYMLQNAGLSFGTVGTAITTWGDVASFGSLMHSVGVPNDSDWFSILNPFTVQNLADAQGGLASGDNQLVNTAWMKAQTSKDFGGMRVIMSNALNSYTTRAGADRTGALNSDPDVTYVTHKDTMLQTLVLKDLDADLPIKAGDVIEITGRNRLNLDTRQTAKNASGTPIVWRATVTADATAAVGIATVVVAGAAIFETDGQYNTVDSAPVEDDVVTILGAASTNLQPSLFYHQEAFGLGTVKLPKLFSTDTVATTEDGFSIRVSKYADGDANKQMVRFDLLPAFVTFNPFYGGTGWG